MKNQPNFEQYTQTLRNFYTKVMKGHSNMIKLTRNFMKIIDDISKSENALRISGLSRRKSQVSITVSKSKSVNSMRSLSQIRLCAKPDHLFWSPQLKKTILYSYLHFIISSTSTQIFNMIDTKSKLLIDSVPENRITDRTKWDRCVSEWKKIMQLMNHKNKVRWEKMMNIAIGGLQLAFVDVLLRAISHSSSQLAEVFVDPQANLQAIAGLLKISICFEVHDQQKVISKQIFGDFKNQIKIAYFKQQQLYYFFGKLDTLKAEDPSTKAVSKQENNLLSVMSSIRQMNPNRHDSGHTVQISITESPTPSSPALSKTSQKKPRRSIIDDYSEKSLGQTSRKRPTLPVALIRKKNLRVIETLLKEYHSNTFKLMDLEVFENQESKDAKIKKILQSRRKLEE